MLLVAPELYSSDLLNVRAKVLFDKSKRSWDWDLKLEVYNFEMKNFGFWILKQRTFRCLNQFQRVTL